MFKEVLNSTPEGGFLPPCEAKQSSPPDIFSAAFDPFSDSPPQLNAFSGLPVDSDHRFDWTIPIDSLTPIDSSNSNGSYISNDSGFVDGPEDSCE